MVTQQGWLLQRWCFPIASGTYFYRGKWELVNLKNCFQKCKHQFLAFFSFLKNQNRALKDLVSALEKSFSIAFVVKSGPSLFSQGPFSYSLSTFSYSLGPFSYRPDPFYSVRPFSSRLGLFMLNGALFQTERPPYPQWLARLWNVRTINNISSPGPPFKMRGHPLFWWIFVL